MASQTQYGDPRQRLAVAKTSFVSCLMRRDPDPVPRDEIDRWHAALTATLEQCTTENIQTCKRWLVKYASHSPARVSALGKYLAALSIALPSLPPTQSKQGEEGKVSPRAKRLFLVYLVSDLFYHDTGDNGQAVLQTVAVNLKPHLRSLFASASDLNLKRNKSIPRQLHVVLDCWKEHQYYSDSHLDKLRLMIEATDKAEVDMSDDDGDAKEVVPSVQKVQPYMLPAVHGDESSPWFRQPAGVMLYEMAMSPGRPIDPKRMKPMRFKPGPAPEKIADAVRDFIEDVGKIGTTRDADASGSDVDVDALGRLTLKDPETGEVTQSDSYYGWSRDFVKTISQFRGKKKIDETEFKPLKRWDIPRDPSRSSSLSRSPDGRRPHFSHGRRPYSGRSKSRDQSRSSRGRSRSRTRSSSPSRQRRYSRSRSQSGSSSRYRSRNRSKSRSRSYSPERSRSNSRPGFRGPKGYGREGQFQRSSRPGDFSVQRPPPPPPPDQGYQRPDSRQQHPGQYGQPPLGRGGPSPPPPPPPQGMPPRPPNWQGPWPPPPPPPNMMPGQMPFPPFSGPPIPPQMYGNFLGPPPPPNIPPPPPTHWPPPYPQPPGYGNQGGPNYGGGYGNYKGR